MIKKILSFRFSLCFLFFVFILSSTTFSQIIDFNPKTITAGTGSVLTFTGIGFGSSRGPNAYVAFSRQDPTNLTPIKVLESDYILWTDTKIQVKVPAGAGTGGPIIIIDQTRGIYLGQLTISNTINNGPAYISSFSPTSISAGTQSLITINGSGFGSTPGSVFFKWSGADGDVAIGTNSSEIISWSNTQIVAKVSESAGSGIISVILNGDHNNPIKSNTPLTVKYAVFTSYNALPLILSNNNGNGGYTFRMETNFANNTAASTSFKKAMDTWVCATNINWGIGPTTTVSEAASTNVNMVKFGGASEIIVGTLAYTSMGFNRCPNGEWELGDVDITFNNQDYNWNYTSSAPSSNQYDFETVALHQLGHAHGLVHVNNVGDPMYYNTKIGTTNRSLNAAVIEGGNFMLTNSAAMGALSCNGAIIPFPAGSCGFSSPTITSFTPTTGTTGTVVTITGTNFSSVMDVRFGNVIATSFNVVSPSVITAIVASGATGDVSITTPGGTATKSGFTYLTKSSQTLTFNTFPNKTYGDIDFDPNVTASSGLPVTYTSSNPLVATIVNNKVHIISAGTTIITATQIGNATYNPATVNLNLLVNKANQSISLSTIPTKLITDPDFDLDGIATSGLMVTYTSSNPAVATIINSRVHIVGAGTTKITAVQNGDANYNPATPISIDLTISKFAQTITFPNLSAKELNSPDFDPGATSSAGLDITYTSSNQAVATIVNNKIHIVGAGSTIITALQTGNTEFAAATAVPVTLVVNKSNQTITFLPITVKNYNDPDFELNATASSGLSVAYKSSNTAVATVVGNKVHIIASGATVITAMQVGNNNFNAAVEVPQNLDVVYTLPVSNFTIKSTDVTCKGSGNGALQITATQTLSYTATISGNNKTTTHPFNSVLAVNNLAAGTYNVCITINGQANYKQCFDLVIKEPKDLAVYSSLKNDGNTVVLKLEGSNFYKIDLNGQVITTTDQEISLPLIKGNNIVKISSDKTCQGVIERTFLTTNRISLYPNPVKDILYISTGSNESSLAKIEIHSLDGRLVHASQHIAAYGRVGVDLSKLSKGLHVLTLSIGNTKTIHKVLKD